MPECETFKLKMRFEYFSAADPPDADPSAILCAIALANCTCAHLCLQMPPPAPSPATPTSICRRLRKAKII